MGGSPFGSDKWGLCQLRVVCGACPVPGAAVTAAAEDAATTRVAFTDAAGLAELRALNPSPRYVVTVELAGFRTSRQAGVLVRAGQTAPTTRSRPATRRPSPA